MEKKEILRKIPKVDELLKKNEIKNLLEQYDFKRENVLEAIRINIEKLRQNIINSNDNTFENGIDTKNLLDDIIKTAEKINKKSLSRVINATGVVLHTNLGRAKLSKYVCDNVVDVAMNYSTLEYNIDNGSRGSRHDHVERLITKITGAEAAMVVNNNAAATMLCLSVMAKNKEVIVSRGELVEIGGSFRIPEIMELSNAILKDVGTTNKTHTYDYEQNINENTAALLKVHTSNYKIIGFTSEVELKELVSIGKSYNIPVIYDMGSGLMVDLKKYGIYEPTILESLNTGIDVILFSSDKLLGGPQGGIIAGKKEYIDKMKKHQLARVLRVDKLTLSAMEATFEQYMDLDKSTSLIPTLKMLTKDSEELKKLSEYFKNEILRSTNFYDINIEKVYEKAGGGTAPESVLEGYAVSIKCELSSEILEHKLRNCNIPIIVRVYRDRVYIYMRTLEQDEIEYIIKSLIDIEHDGGI